MGGAAIKPRPFLPSVVMNAFRFESIGRLLFFRGIPHGHDGEGDYMTRDTQEIPEALNPLFHRINADPYRAQTEGIGCNEHVFGSRRRNRAASAP